MTLNIKDPPEFVTEIERWNRQTLADGEEMAKVPEALLNNDIYLKARIDHQDQVTPVTLAADGWAANGDVFEQTVPVDGATEDSEALLVSALEDGASADAQKAYNKAFGIVCSGTARLAEGAAVFKVYKHPDADITVGLRGIGTGGGGMPGGSTSGGGESGTYILLPATATRLGGVKIGDGVGIQQDGTISVNGTSFIDEVSASDADVAEMLNEVFNTPGEDAPGGSTP